MEHMSLVKFHKYPRRLLLTRRNLARIPTATTRYIHQSGGFTTLMSDLGLEGIGNYVTSMKEKVSELRQMSETGSVDAPLIRSLVDTVNNSRERNETNLCHIRNSLVRFMHTDAEPIIRPRMPGRQAARSPGRDAEESVEPDSPQMPAVWGAPKEAAGCDVDDE
jgi:hypothetical protein